MKKILLLSIMLISYNILCASVYIISTNAGVFRLNDKSGIISFKGTEYIITNYEDGGYEANYVFCNYNSKKVLFLINFSKGSIIEYSYIELFERRGVAKYNKKELVSGLYRNIDTYAQNNNLSGDRAIAFKGAAIRMIKGIENGTGSIDEAGNYIDSTGTMSSTGKFDKGFLGRVKNTENNALGIAGHYILDYLNQMPTCDSNWEQVGSPYIILKAEKME